MSIMPDATMVHNGDRSSSQANLRRRDCIPGGTPARRKMQARICLTWRGAMQITAAMECWARDMSDVKCQPTPVVQSARAQSPRPGIDWLLVLVLAALIALCDPSRSHAQEVWFGPPEPGKFFAGPPDWHETFEPHSPWRIARTHTQAFLFNSGYFEIPLEEDQKRVAAYLREHNIAVALGVQAVAWRSDTDCGHGEEGYYDPREAAFVAAKLHRLGITPKYIQMDGPLWFGHFDPNSRACQTSVEDVVRRSELILKPFLATFPNVELGDVEPIVNLTSQPNWQALYEDFKSRLEASIGKRLSFLQFDVDWRNPAWPEHVRLGSEFARQAGMKVGVIYNGDGSDTSAVAWIKHAMQNYERIESGLGIVPDQAIFATWDHYPVHLLPETSDSAHTYLIDQYLVPRSKITAERTTTGVRGTLTDAQGHPVPDAPIDVRTLGVSLSRPVPVQTVSGVVPPNAKSAIIGIRINTECFCAGPNDILLGDITYQESAGGKVFHTVHPPAKAPSGGPASADSISVQTATIAGTDAVRLKVPADLHYGSNSPDFAVTPGARFTFQAPLGSINGQGMYGSIALIWFDQNSKGLFRTDLRLPPDSEPVGSVRTDSAGSFAFSGVAPDRSENHPFELIFPGSHQLRPAYLDIR
ncbi:MAG TPA: hypothetical protein VGG99_30115 [Acetobacteraceae bacterium]